MWLVFIGCKSISIETNVEVYFLFIYFFSRWLECVGLFSENFGLFNIPLYIYKYLMSLSFS